MGNVILGVDVDLTIVQSDEGWFEWNNKLSASEDHLTLESALEKFNGVLPYNISDLYPNVDKEKSYDYWRQSNLYDNMQPMEGAEEILHRFHEVGHKIVFVSALKGDHHKSKVRFLKKYFPYMSGFIGTKEKQFAKVDVLIDDRHKNLVGLENNSVVPILFKTPYEQEVQLQNDVITFDSWVDLLKNKEFI